MKDVVVIVVKGGSVEAVHTTRENIGNIVIDLDQIKVGEERDTKVYEPDSVDTVENILKSIKEDI